MFIFNITKQLQYSYTRGDLHSANGFNELHLFSRSPRIVGQSKHRRMHRQTNGKHQIKAKSNYRSHEIVHFWHYQLFVFFVC